MDSHGLHPDVLIFHPTTDHLDFPMVTSHPSGGRQAPGIGYHWLSPCHSSCIPCFWILFRHPYRVHHCDKSETGLAYRATFVFLNEPLFIPTLPPMLCQLYTWCHAAFLVGLVTMLFPGSYREVGCQLLDGLAILHKISSRIQKIINSHRHFWLPWVSHIRIQSPCDPHRESLRWSPSKAQRGAQRLEQRHGAEGSLRGWSHQKVDLFMTRCLDEYDEHYTTDSKHRYIYIEIIYVIYMYVLCIYIYMYIW